MRRWRAPALLVLVAGAPPASGTLRFDRVFATGGEPARLHYQVAYLTGGATHRLEVWRDGDRRIKRVTDGTIASFATRGGDEAGYALVVLDRKQRISTRIDRANLYRIGQFTDWFDLGHGLRHPKTTYSLTSGQAPRAAPRPIEPCAWYDLAQGRHTTHVCWSAAEHLPLLLVTDTRPVWRVTALDHRPPAPGTFTVDDRGYVHNDANRDIEQD